MSTAKDKPQRGTPVRIEWQVPPDLPTHGVTNMTVNFADAGEFFITFFEVRPPLILDDEQAMQQLESVPARAVARVMVTADRVKSIIAALQHNYDVWAAKQNAEEGEDGC
jgi:hypothetical protein